MAFDNGLRYGLLSSYLRGRLNEPVCKRYFETVFEDKGNLFGALTIYRVSDHVREDAGSNGIKDRNQLPEATR